MEDRPVTAEPRYAELHLHLEGALTAARALALWKDATDVPPPPGEGIASDGWKFRDFMGFLELFGWGTKLLRGPEAYVSVLQDLLSHLEASGVAYAEVFVAFGQMQRLGVDPATILPPLARIASERAESGGCDLRFVADATRQWGVSAAERVLDAALDLQRHRIVGFGMGGDERALRARDFRTIYRRAERAGLGLSCHAGEGTTADAVREAVEELGVRRIGHGIAAVEDPRLMRELATEGVVLEICPTSNERTGVWDPRRGPHPALALHAAGVPLVLGSDDPAFFDCDLKVERQRLLEMGLGEDALRAWNERAVEVSFLDRDERRGLRARILGDER